MKPRLAISFSGGRTSAVMTRYCLQHYGPTHDIVVTFANTGCEHEETLKFVKACDEHWGFNTVWLEAVVGPPGVGIRHKRVTFETASRNGEPFEAYIAKYGIPGPQAPQCTSRLKTEVMDSYIQRELGWKARSYQIAIGIRADEFDRINSNAEALGFVYPLVKLGITKDDVKQIMAREPWDLKLAGEHYGNCTWCWKKSLRKHLTLIRHSPEVFEFPERMERKYAAHKAENDIGQRRFFRNNLTVADLRRLAQQPFEEYSDRRELQPGLFVDMDLGAACGDSCEIGADQ